MALHLVAVEFKNYISPDQGPLAGSFSVLAKDIDAFLASQDTSLLNVDYVYYRHDERGIFRAYGKAWWSGIHGRMCRIGGGAYGDAPAWHA